MKNITAEELLAMLGEKNTSIDLGTEINFSNSAEMYSNSNKKKNLKLNKNTFQQSNANVRGQAPLFSSSPSATSVEEVQGIPEDHGLLATEPKYGRRLNYQQDKIVEMHLQLGTVKQGTRYSRVKAYISIKTETDTRYMIFMRSALTSALDETFRSIRKDCDKKLESIASDIYVDHHNQGLFMGRVKYKIVKGNKIAKHHRKNLPQTMLSIYIEDGYWHAKFYLIDKCYDFVLDEELSDKQKQFYSAQGTWIDNETSLTLQEAFGG